MARTSGVTKKQLEDAVAQVAGLPPEDLNSLQELADAIGDDPNFVNTVSDNLDAHAEATTNVHGIQNTSELETQTGAQAKADAAEVSANSYTDTKIDSEIVSHNNATQNVHGIADTSALATSDDVSSAQTAAETFATTAVTNHGDATTNVHGIADTSELTTSQELDTSISAALVSAQDTAATLDLAAIQSSKDYTDTETAAAVSEHNTDTTNVHGIADTSALATDSDVSNAQAAAQSFATSEVAGHNDTTTNIHGISDTSELLLSDTSISVSGLNNSGTTVLSNTVSLNGRINTSIVPETNGDYSLGNSSLKWDRIWVDDGIFLGGENLQNRLGYYESGYWSPSMTEGVNITFTASNCLYVRVGDLVYVRGVITIPSNSAGGSLDSNSLPFAVERGSMGSWTQLPSPSSGNIGFLKVEGSIIEIYKGDGTFLNSTSLSNRSIDFTATYRTNA